MLEKIITGVIIVGVICLGLWINRSKGGSNKGGNCGGSCGCH